MFLIPIRVLKLSDFHQIDLGFQYAVAELKCLSPMAFEPSLKLQLGRQFRIHECSFRVMIERPVSSISRLEAPSHRMGMEYFWILMRHAPAYTEPTLDQLGGLCDTPRACSAVWKDEWWNGIARHLLHPSLLAEARVALLPSCRRPISMVESALAVAKLGLC